MNQGLQWRGIGHPCRTGESMNRSPVIRDWESAHTYTRTHHAHSLPRAEDYGLETVWTLTMMESISHFSLHLWGHCSLSMWPSLRNPHPVPKYVSCSVLPLIPCTLNLSSPLPRGCQSICLPLISLMLWLDCLSVLSLNYYWFWCHCANFSVSKAFSAIQHAYVQCIHQVSKAFHFSHILCYSFIPKQALKFTFCIVTLLPVTSATVVVSNRMKNRTGFCLQCHREDSHKNKQHFCLFTASSFLID